MAWVRTTEPHGDHRLYQSAVVNSTSIRPRLADSMVNALRQVSFENHDSNLTQLQLEMIATVVSATNECRY